MEKTEILSKLNEIFCDVLDNEDIELSYETTADDIEEWDSLSHIQLIVAIEKAFKIRLKAKEMVSWLNVGDAVESIYDKLN